MSNTKGVSGIPVKRGRAPAFGVVVVGKGSGLMKLGGLSLPYALPDEVMKEAQKEMKPIVENEEKNIGALLTKYNAYACEGRRKKLHDTAISIPRNLRFNYAWDSGSRMEVGIRVPDFIAEISSVKHVGMSKEKKKECDKLRDGVLRIYFAIALKFTFAYGNEMRGAVGGPKVDIHDSDTATFLNINERGEIKRGAAGANLNGLHFEEDSMLNASVHVYEREALRRGAHYIYAPSTHAGSPGLPLFLFAVGRSDIDVHFRTGMGLGMLRAEVEGSIRALAANYGKKHESISATAAAKTVPAWVKKVVGQQIEVLNKVKREVFEIDNLLVQHQGLQPWGKEEILRVATQDLCGLINRLYQRKPYKRHTPGQQELEEYEFSIECEGKQKKEETGNTGAEEENEEEGCVSPTRPNFTLHLYGGKSAKARVNKWYVSVKLGEEEKDFYAIMDAVIYATRPNDFPKEEFAPKSTWKDDEADDDNILSMCDGNCSPST